MIIGMCDGVFDLMHVGHIKLLNKCKQHCDFLIVAVADDNFAKGKGEDRPYIKQEARLLSIKSLRAVDLAILCDGTINIVNQINPDIYFKKWDYTPDPGLDNSIKFMRIEGIESTTGLVEMIKRKDKQ